MEAHGMPKGLHKYWRNKITVPAECVDSNDDAEGEEDDELLVEKPKTPIITSPSSSTATPRPTSTPLHSAVPLELEYELREAVALSSIIINISDLFGSGVDPSAKSHVAWALLQSQYGRVSDRARNMRENALASCKMEEGAKVAGEDGHIEEMRTLRRAANEAGAKISDSRFITKLLDSFPESWDPVITPMYGETDLSKVLINLTTHAERLSIRLDRNGKKPTTGGADSVRALEATVIALQAEMKTLKGSRTGGGSTNPDKQHLKCANQSCGKTGHLIADCFQAGGGKAGQYPHWWKGKRTAQTIVANMASIVEIPGGHYALSAAINVEEIKRLIEENLPVEQRVQTALAASENTSIISNACIADSGCTSYFFKSRDAFVTYNPIKTLVGQSSKSGANFSVLGFGNVEISVVNNNKRHTLLLKDALHAPDVTANLISISKMDLAGWDAVFGGQKVRFFKDKVEIFSGSLKGGLYLINGSLIMNQPTALTANSLRSPSTLANWHRRFAHFGVTRINGAKTLVDGLEILEDGNTQGQCEDCIIGNQKRRPYDEKVTPTTEILKLTNIDIWGPARVPSTGNAIYAMKFHDSGSSHRKSFFLKDRLAVTTLYALTTYKNGSEKVTGKKMIYIRSDNAPEFKSKLWEDYMRENGLTFVPTAPYSSSSNGTSERSIGITTASVRIMLLDSGMSAKWWAEAWQYSEVVDNLLPSARHPGKIPEERWTGERQDVGHLRVWGCIAYVHIPKEKGLGKLGNRGQKGRLIGVESRGIFRILIPETGEIIRSRNVRFEEGPGHRTLTQEGEYFVNDNEDVDLDFLLPQLETPENVNNTVNTTPTIQPITPDVPTQALQQQPKTRQRIVYPPASRRSARLAGNNASAAPPNIAQLPPPNQNQESHTDDSNVPILEDSDEEDDIISALSANTSTPVPEPLNRFIPESFYEAYDISRRHLWFPTMEKEIQRWDDRGVVTPVERPPGVKTIKTRWIFDEKTDGTGGLVKRRGRCVVKGFTQKLGEHYWESFAAVVRYESVRMLLALTAAKGLKIRLVDVVGAFLNAKPQGENFLEIPQGFENHYTIASGVDTVLKMELNIYGTMDGANNWARLLNTTFNELGHKRSRADPCMRIQYTKDGGYTITATYTDDVTGASSSNEAESQTFSEIEHKFEVTDHGRPVVILGMGCVLHDNGDISIHQKALIVKALVDHGMTECNPKYTPLPPSVDLFNSQPLPIPDEDKFFMLDKPYRKACGTFNHIANGTRPDIAFSVMLLMRYATDPRPIHWRLILHLLAYLKATMNLGITYRSGGTVKPVGYSDSSYADEIQSRKSSAGYVFLSTGGAVGWKAKTQQRVSTSTGEAEYIGVFEAGKQAKWMTSWYTELDQFYDLPVTVYCDNKAAVILTKNANGHSKIKHISMKAHWIREIVETKEVLVEGIATDENIADIFTKALHRPKHEKFVKMMGMEILNI